MRSQQNTTCRVTNCLSLLMLSLLLLTGAVWGQSGTLSTTAFGMQCGPSTSTNCPPNSEGVITLPTEPGTLRLWDSKVNWSYLNPSSGTYSLSNLDTYLYAINAASNVKDVIYTFGFTPCWDAGLAPNCGTNSTAPNGTPLPPTDLVLTSCGPNGTGSSSFNAFVQQLTTHCAPATMTEPQVCVKDVIKEYEMWNEANTTNFWGETAWSTATSAEELYCMAAPGAKIIKANVTGAKILTPSINAATTNYETWMEDWLGDEVSGGIISNLYNFHIYLKSATYTPEYTYANVVVNQLAPNNGGLVSGWTALPWLVSETNFDPGTLECDNSHAADCTGQIVRWQAILNSEGALNLSWYWWNTTIGDYGDSSDLNPAYAEAYYYMMQYMVGGKFTAACSYTTSGSIETWTCPFTEAGGTGALFVWAYEPGAEASTTYTVPSGYVDYRTLTGGTTTVTGGENITIGVEPFMLEK
ncbi:MAG: hypothetical protein ABR874_03685 [Candidatus Sulfotelmatobacter sp.]|jgi:hypothetical protein